MSTIPDLIEKAIEIFGSARKLSIAADVTHPTIIRAQRGLCSGDLAVRIELATKGKITRQMLRPDLYGARPLKPGRRHHRKDEKAND